jgi:hypothetical protein
MIAAAGAEHLIHVGVAALDMAVDDADRLAAQDGPAAVAGLTGGRLAAGVSAVVLALAVAAGARSPPAAWGPLIFVESASARLSGMLLAFGTKAPLGYAFVAGMIASVNPCGFMLLPAYLGYYLGDDPEAPGACRRAGRALLEKTFASCVSPAAVNT